MIDPTEAIMFESDLGTPTGPITLGLIQVAKERGHPVYYANRQNEISPDTKRIIYFCNKPPRHINTKGAKLGWWFCDLRRPKDITHHTSVSADAIFLCNTEYKKDFEDHFSVPVHFIPQSGLIPSSKVCRGPVPDAVFIGGTRGKYHADRPKYLQAIKKAGISLSVITDEGQTKDQEGLYYHAKFCPSISPPALHYTSNRTYNILASGGLCVIRSFPGIQDLFTDMENVVVFQDERELVYKLKDLYHDKEERQRIAKNGQELCDAEHTPHRRFDDMMATLKDV